MSIIATGAIEGLGLGPDAWGYGIMIENSNAAAQNVELRVYAFDAGGTLIDTSKTVLIAVQAQSRGAAVELSWFGSATITVADVSQNGNAVTGVVSTDAGKDLANSSVHAIIIDSSGTIVGGGVDVAVIAAAGTTPFDVLLSGDLSGGELVVLASPSGVEL